MIPAASLTGQAAGTAAALAVGEGCDLSQIPVRKLQRQLADAGVLIHAGESKLEVT